MARMKLPRVPEKLVPVVPDFAVDRLRCLAVMRGVYSPSGGIPLPAPWGQKERP